MFYTINYILLFAFFIVNNEIKNNFKFYRQKNFNSFKLDYKYLSVQQNFKERLPVCLFFIFLLLLFKAKSLKSQLLKNLVEKNQ